MNTRILPRFLLDIIKQRNLIFELSKKDFQSKYLGSHLGILWAFVQPTIMIFIFWFVFQIGFKSMPVENFPFILWLMAGIVPWFFFSESFSNATNSVLENSYLVKKIVFRVSILPIVKICSALFIHSFFLIILFIVFFVYGYLPNLYNLQVFYYVFALIILVLGLSWLTSSLIIFLRDIGQIVVIILQFGFWITPIFWSLNIVPEDYHILFKLNPLFYIVEGFRSSFIYYKWFWETPYLTIYFWGVTLTIFIIGGIVFKRLKPHFADVL